MYVPSPLIIRRVITLLTMVILGRFLRSGMFDADELLESVPLGL